MPPSFVGLGAMPMRALQHAYASAVHRRAGAVGTLHVLVEASVFEKRLPPWLLVGSRNGFIRLIADPSRMPEARLTRAAVEWDPEVPAILREVEWRVRRNAGRFLPVKRSDVEDWDRRPRWTADARTMLAGTLAVAREHGVPFASLTHLLLAMLRMPECSGTRFVFPYEYARVAAVERLSGEPGLRRTDQSSPDFGELGLVLRPESGRRSARLAARALSRMSRLARIGPLLTTVENESRRQAVRLGHGVIGPAHTLLAMVALDDLLAAAGLAVPASHAGHNRAGGILRAYGLDAARLSRAVAELGEPAEPPADALAEQMEHLRLGDPFDATGAAGARAAAISLTRRHPDTGTSHLLLATLQAGDEDDAGDAAAVLRALGIDPAEVRDHVERDLHAVPPSW